MFPNDLWQSHLLTRPAVGKILIIPGGEEDELPGVGQLGRSHGSSHIVPCCAAQDGAHAGTSR